MDQTDTVTNNYNNCIIPFPLFQRDLLISVKQVQIELFEYISIAVPDVFEKLLIPLAIELLPRQIYVFSIEESSSCSC